MTGSPTALATRTNKKRSERQLAGAPIVGKDVLELLSSAMYLDPRAVYREYIQNAADAIDSAFEQGILKEPRMGTIQVSLDPQARLARIRDDGVGVPTARAEKILTSIGASMKRGQGVRGFRGVGRLAAFGYAQAVSFKTKAAGENVSTEVRWDCRKLKEALRDPSYAGDLGQIVRDVVTIVIEDAPSVSEHFFEVTLEKVLRIKNDILLNAAELERYLGEITPAPFHKDFQFAETITRFLSRHVKPPRFRIFVNGSDDPVTRPHRDTFAVTTARTDAIDDVELLAIPDGDGGVRAVGWILHHGYSGAIHASPDLKGLRARVGDIQIGTGDLFLETFKEPRFNSWTIGELHIVDPKIIPNGRRDGFEQGRAFTDLLAEVGLIARSQGTRCRQSSTRRNRIRAFEMREARVEDLFSVLAQHGLPASRAARTKRDIAGAFNEMKRLAKSSVLTEVDQRRMHRRLAALESRFTGLREIAEKADPFAEKSPAERAAYTQMIDLIYDFSSNKAAARALVDKIMSHLAAQRLRAVRRAGKAGSRRSEGRRRT